MNPTRKWTFGGVAAALLVLALGWVLVISPARNALAETEEAVLTQQASNSQLAARLDTLKKQSAEVPAKLAEIEAVKKKMPADMRQPALVRALESAAESSGADLTELTAAPPAADTSSGEATLVVLPYTLTATGSYSALKTYVDSLERLDRAFLIKTVDISRETGEEELTMQLSGNFYTLMGLDTGKPAATQPDTAAAAARIPAR